MNSKELKEKIKELNADQNRDREEAKQIKELIKHQAKLQEYEQHLDTLGPRNSFQLLINKKKEAAFSDSLFPSNSFCFLLILSFHNRYN